MVHLKSWLLEEVESFLCDLSPEQLYWVDVYLTQLWRDVSLPQLLVEAEFILPELAFHRFLDFACRNYRAELIAALGALIHAANQ